MEEEEAVVVVVAGGVEEQHEVLGEEQELVRVAVLPRWTGQRMRPNLERGTRTPVCLAH